MYQDILFPVDLNHPASWTEVLPSVVQYCRAFQARLHVVTVLPDFGMPIVGGFFPKNFSAKAMREADQHLKALVAEQVPADVHARHIVAEGVAYKEILRVAKEIQADLIILASPRAELGDFLMGPNAERVVRHAEASVLVIKN